VNKRGAHFCHGKVHILVRKNEQYIIKTTNKQILLSYMVLQEWLSRAAQEKLGGRVGCCTTWVETAGRPRIQQCDHPKLPPPDNAIFLSWREHLGYLRDTKEARVTDQSACGWPRVSHA
jgi:hypothetical protein